MNAVTPPEDRVETEGGLCGSSGGRDRNVRLTLAKVNKELAQGDIKALLAKGDGYFYFWSGEAADWLDRTVRVERTNDLSLEERGEVSQVEAEKNQRVLAARKPGRERAGQRWREA